MQSKGEKGCSRVVAVCCCCCWNGEICFSATVAYYQDDVLPSVCLVPATERHRIMSFDGVTDKKDVRRESCHGIFDILPLYSYFSVTFGPTYATTPGRGH